MIEQILSDKGLAGVVIFALGGTVVFLAGIIRWLLGIIFKLYEQRQAEALKVQEINQTITHTVQAWVDKISEVKK